LTISGNLASFKGINIFLFKPDSYAFTDNNVNLLFALIISTNLLRWLQHFT
jgi:hypothetical protein